VASVFNHRRDGDQPVRKDLDKEFIFPPSRLEAMPPKRPKCLVPFVLVVILLALMYFY